MLVESIAFGELATLTTSTERFTATIGEVMMLLAFLFCVAGLGISVANWKGYIGHDLFEKSPGWLFHPDSLAVRVYLTIPGWISFLIIIAANFGYEYLNVPLPVAGVIAGVGVLGIASTLILMIALPNDIRPEWQRRQKAAIEAEARRLDEAREAERRQPRPTRPPPEAPPE